MVPNEHSRCAAGSGRRALSLPDGEDAGWSTIRATDGQQAIEAFERQPDDIQLVILDVMMPVKSGVDVIQSMRRIRPDLPAILLSGYDGHVVRKAGEPFEFFRKPFSLPKLLSCVERCCAEAS